MLKGAPRMAEAVRGVFRKRKNHRIGRAGRACDAQQCPDGKPFCTDAAALVLKKETAGGGIWMNFRAHSLDKVCYLTGSRIESVTGKCTFACEQTDVDGSAQILARTVSGVTAANHHLRLSGDTGLRNHRVYLEVKKEARTSL